MKELWETKTRVALPTMIAVQSFGTMCSFAGSVVAVQAAADLGVKSTMIGVYTATLYIVAMVSGLAAGGFLTRFGVIRTSQWALLCAMFGLWIGGAIQAWPAALAAAVLIGIGQGPQNPASSRILARHTPPRWQPLVFSIKQTGTPMGGMLAGVLLPPLILLYDWRVAILAITLLPLVTAFGLQFLRPGLDDDRQPDHAIGLAGVTGALAIVMRERRLAALAVTGMLYTFVQMAILSFIVIFLEEGHGLSTAFAGGVFAIINGAAIPARIFWGLIAGRLLSSWALLGWIGVMMAASIIAVSFFTTAWPFWLVTLVALALGASINGVLGLLLAEFARLAPPDQVGEATGGGQFFLFLGIVIGPPTFGAMVEFGGGYQNAYYLIAAAALLAGGYLLITARTAGTRDARRPMSAAR